MTDKAISVDESGVVRILDAEKFRQTEKLQEEAVVFSNSIDYFMFVCLTCSELSEFFSIAKGIVEEVETQAKYIETQKLKVSTTNWEIDLMQRRQSASAISLRSKETRRRNKNRFFKLYFLRNRPNSIGTNF